MSISLKKELYGAEIPATAKIYEVNVFRTDLLDDSKNISHRYDARIKLKYFSEKTGEEIKEKEEILIVEGVSSSLIDYVLPAVYKKTQEKIGGESDEKE